MKKLTFILLTFMLVSLNGHLLAKERVPGTKILIDPPKEFIATSQFPGFMMESTGSSIMVNRIPGGPYSVVVKGFSPMGLANRGMQFRSREEVSINGTEAVLLQVSQNAYGTEFLKWMLVLGDAQETVLVVASFPLELEQQLAEILKAALLSVSWDKSLKLNLFEGLTFTVAESGSLQFANKIGNNLFLTENGVFPVKDRGTAMVIVGSSLSQGWQVPTDIQTFSLQRLRQTRVLSAAKVISERAVNIDELEGYLIQASAVDEDTAQEL
ncbi:MAG: hypothetical protein V7677_19850, partial [Motiliproteus sp.]